MKTSELLHALQSEIRHHDFSTFVDEPPSMAQGGKGVTVPGLPEAIEYDGTVPGSSGG
jgi:hypothetical protein